MAPHSFSSLSPFHLPFVVIKMSSSSSSESSPSTFSSDHVFPGRYTAELGPDQSYVVFLIGMRVNSFWRLNKWVPIAKTMPKMLKALSSDPSLGMLHCESFFRLCPLTTCLVSYWKDFESLERFSKLAGSPDSHLAVWGRFMKQVGSDGTVGIWHETYQIHPKNSESVYANMPEFGMAKAFSHVKVNPNTQSARQRIHKEQKDEQEGKKES